MQVRDEVGIFLFFDDLLEFERKPTSHTLDGLKPRFRKTLLAGDLNFVQFYNVLKRGHVTLFVWSPTAYLDDDNKRGLEERRVCSRVQGRRTRLE
jgi:hypothetical protein